MNSFEYNIEANSEAAGKYIKHLLEMHGMPYPWQIKPQTTKGYDIIRIAISKNVKGLRGNQDRNRYVLISELYITINEIMLKEFGLKPKKENNITWGYLIPANINSSTIPSNSFLIPIRHVRGMGSDARKWMTKYYFSGKTFRLNMFSGKRLINGVWQGVMSVDLLGFLSSSMLGPLGEVRDLKLYEDWAEVYGNNTSQSICNITYVDQIIKVIKDMLITLSPEAFPIEIGCFPPGKTAPIIITGDSDDATTKQINKYLSVLEKHGIHATIIMKDYKSYRKSFLKNILSRNHSFGIHPYSKTGTVDEYISNFKHLSYCHKKIFDIGIAGVRNHRFQWLGQTTAIELGKDAKVFFDLNCVAASGHTWLGTGSGVGIPIAFPPQKNVFHSYPMQLPTIFEDDVFLFEHDYCYKPFKDGDKLALSTVIDFLNEWIVIKNLPAVVNLHPEHVNTDVGVFLNKIAQWASVSKIWSPTLFEYYNWIRKKNRACIEIRFEEKKIYINNPVSVIIRVNNVQLGEKNHEYVAKKNTILDFMVS